MWKLLAYCAHYGGQQVQAGGMMAMDMRSLNLFARALSEIIAEQNAENGGAGDV